VNPWVIGAALLGSLGAALALAIPALPRLHALFRRSARELKKGQAAVEPSPRKTYAGKPRQLET
jgi:hypothetical protein